MKTKFATAMMITVAAGSLMTSSAQAASRFEIRVEDGPPCQERMEPADRRDWREPPERREWREPPPQHHDRRPPPPQYDRQGPHGGPGPNPPRDRFEPPHHDRPAPPPPQHDPRRPRGVPPR